VSDQMQSPFQMLEEISQSSQTGLTDWEKEFVTSVAKQHRKGGSGWTMSERQQDVLERIWNSFKKNNAED